jgi:hypothetical protein
MDNAINDYKKCLCAKIREGLGAVDEGTWWQMCGGCDFLPPLVVDYLDWLPGFGDGSDPTAALGYLLCKHGVHLRAHTRSEHGYCSYDYKCSICSYDLTLFYGFVDVRGKLYDPNACVPGETQKWQPLPERLGLVCHFCLPLHVFPTTSSLAITSPLPLLLLANLSISSSVETTDAMSITAEQKKSASVTNATSCVVFVNRAMWCNDMTSDYCFHERDHKELLPRFVWNASRTEMPQRYPMPRGRLLSFANADFHKREWLSLGDGRIELTNQVRENEDNNYTDPEADVRAKIASYDCALCGGYTKYYVLLNKYDGEDVTGTGHPLDVDACVIFCDTCADRDRTDTRAVKREGVTYDIGKIVNVDYSSNTPSTPSGSSGPSASPGSSEPTTDYCSVNRRRLIDLIALKSD